MAIDFPASPTNGQTFTSGTVTYTWDGTKWTAAAGGGGASDKIEEGNTSAEVIDTGSDGRFVVTTEGSERARVDSSGRLLLGTSTARSNVNIYSGDRTPTVQVETAVGSSNNGLALVNNNGSGWEPVLTLATSAGSTVGSNTVVTNNSAVGSIVFAGNDGDQFLQLARITAQVDGTPGNNDMPGRLTFHTTADGASSPTERARIDNSGRLLVGTSSSAESSALLQCYKASGSIMIRNESVSLGNDQFCLTSNIGGNRTANIGVYKTAGNTNPVAYIYLQEEDGGSAFYWTDNSGNFRIGTGVGDVGTTNGTVVGAQTSDERLKNVTGPVEYGLSTVRQIEPVRFTLKTEPETEKIGFIAQQVRPLVPEAVFDTRNPIEGEPEDAPTKLGMEYVALIPVLVNAIKELSAEVDALKDQLQTQ